MEIISNYFPSREKKYNKYEKCKKKDKAKHFICMKKFKPSICISAYPQAVNSTQLLQSSSDSALFPPNTFHI